MVAKERASSSAESEIALALNRVGDELQLIREVLDEIRTDFQWAVQNGRIVVRRERASIHEQLHSLDLFNEGDGVELELNGETVFGEVETVDDGRNEAMVHLIPSNEAVTVRQDALTKIQPDALARQTPSSFFETVQPKTVHRTAVLPELPEPGNLF